MQKNPNPEENKKYEEARQRKSELLTTIDQKRADVESHQEKLHLLESQKIVTVGSIEAWERAINEANVQA